MRRPASYRRRRLLVAAGIWAATAAGVAALEVAGRVLGSPPITHPDLLGAWWRSVGPPTAVFSLLRLALLGALMAWAGCLAAGAALVALGQGRCLIAWSTRLRPPSGTAALRLALGLSAGGAFSACGPVGGPPSPPVLHNLAAPTNRATATSPATARAGTGVPRPGSWWSVRQGESFWSIAAAAVASVDGPEPPPWKVARYWLEVVNSNLSRLPPPRDPNLIYPGQLVLLPPLGIQS